jgi:hypothetical protein
MTTPRHYRQCVRVTFGASFEAVERALVTARASVLALARSKGEAAEPARLEVQRGAQLPGEPGLFVVVATYA